MTKPTTSLEPGLAAVALLVAFLAGCGSPDESGAEAAPSEGESWSVTAWGSRYEVFPEVDPLVAGAVAVAHTHVTRLEDFAPLDEGRVEIVLTGAGSEQAFRADAPVRPGIFHVEILPPSAGDFELTFRIQDGGEGEEIRGGRVRVGTGDRPGGIVVAPAPKGASDAGEPLSFLKEQQWRSEFATAWVRTGQLARSVSGLARLRPPAGGESLVTAPVDGVVQPPAGSRPWPFVGLAVERAGTLFQVAPRVAAERSLPALEADLATLEAELGPARARRTRLEELLALEAASPREVEEARVRVETLEARRSAAARDLEAARSAREGGTASNSLTLKAPFAGEVAQVLVTPGATVAAGEPLARLVRTDRVWVEVSLPPGAAREVATEGVSGLVLDDPERGPIRLEEGLRRIAVAPEVSPETGTVTVLIEAPPIEGLALGTALEAQVLSAAVQEGVVIPASAVVDDGGVPVAYLQLAGESFVRQEVRVLERQGDLLLVEALVPGQRLVVRGGDAIRRSSLMASGQAHGHVH